MNARKVYLVLSIWIGNSTMMFAQGVKTLEAKDGRDAMYLVSANERYRFNEFQHGTVHFNQEKAITARLNYNFFNQEVQFINVNGDTLSIAQKYAIDRVRIGEQLFYHYPTIGYLEVLDRFPSVALVIHQFVQVVRNQEGKVALLDPRSKSYDPLAAWGSDHEKLTLTATRAYYIVDKNKKVYPVQRASFYRIFPRHKTSIRDYVRKHRIRFEQEKEIVQVLQFCSQLKRRKEQL